MTNKDPVSLLKNLKLKPQKSLGQNFLTDESILDEILKAAQISQDDHILEIGPGLGILTEKLTKLAKQVTTIEIDQNLIPHLKKTFKNTTNIEIINDNALHLPPPKTPYKLVANIPYYITSPLIHHYLLQKHRPTSLTLLIQKDVAENICNKKKIPNILSLTAKLTSIPSLVKVVPPSAFHPEPKVDSAILHLETIPKDSPNYLSLSKIQQILSIAKQAFAQKRKKLSNTIAYPSDKRPEHLSVQDWITVTSELSPSK